MPTSRRSSRRSRRPREPAVAMPARTTGSLELRTPARRAAQGTLSSVRVRSRAGTTAWPLRVRRALLPGLVVCGVVAAALVCARSATAAPPAANAPLPTTPSTIAAALTSTTTTLEDAIDAWRVAGAVAPAPNDLVLLALYQQRLTRSLSRRPRLVRATLPLLAPKLRAFVQDVVVAHSELTTI